MKKLGDNSAEGFVTTLDDRIKYYDHDGNEFVPCVHSWQKTMDLRWNEKNISCGNYSRVETVLEQRSVCELCGEEKWEEIE